MLSQAVRVTLEACSPAWVTQPPTICSTSEGSIPARLTSSTWAVAEQLGGVEARQPSVALADGGAHRLDDHRLCHCPTSERIRRVSGCARCPP